jgi:hypothetical protein
MCVVCVSPVLRGVLAEWNEKDEDKDDKQAWQDDCKRARIPVCSPRAPVISPLVC